MYETLFPFELEVIKNSSEKAVEKIKTYPQDG